MKSRWPEVTQVAPDRIGELEHLTPVRPKHLAELLADALVDKA